MLQKIIHLLQFKKYTTPPHFKEDARRFRQHFVDELSFYPDVFYTEPWSKQVSVNTEIHKSPPKYTTTASIYLPKYTQNWIVMVIAGLETNARPRRVKFRPGEWFVRPDQPGGRVDLKNFFFKDYYYYYLKRDDKLVKFYDVMGIQCFRVIHWETIVTKVHSQTLMAMKSGSGVKFTHKNVT